MFVSTYNRGNTDTVRILTCDKIDNDALKQVFQSLNAMMIKEVDPGDAADEMFAKGVITRGDYDAIFSVSDRKDRCRKLFVILHDSSHPETFIHLRLALLDEYPGIVDEIDKQVTSLTTLQPHLQQLHPSHSADGNLLLVPCNFIRISEC